MAFMTFNEYKKQQAEQRELDKYKMDNSRYGAVNDAMNDAMDNSSYADSMAKAYENALAYKNSMAQAHNNGMAPAYNNSMAQAYENSQAAKSVADKAAAERRKELLAIRARKKKIIQEIDELKKELQQRTQLQSFEDKYKDSPFWKLAKKHYIDTGDMGAIDSFITRENALQEANANREFNREQNELNRGNTFELNKAQKTEQLEYDLDDAQEKVELAENNLKSTKALGVPADVKNAQIAFNAAVKRLNKIREQLGIGDSEYELEEYDNTESSGNNERNRQDILDGIPANYRYKTKAEKDAILKEISEHSAYENQDKEMRDTYIKIRDTKTSEEIKEKKEKVNADTTQKVNAYNAALANYLKYYVQMSDIADPAINKNGYNADEATLLNVKNNMTRAYNALPESLTDKALKKTPDGKSYYDKIRAEGGK